MPTPNASLDFYPEGHAILTVWVPLDADPSVDPASTQAELDGTSYESSIDWTESDVVKLHCSLLADIAALADPSTPLSEVFETLHWVFTDRERDNRPFSFASCLRVAGTSPLSTYPYFGRLDVDEVRDLLRAPVRQWLRNALDQLPDWIRDAIRQNPQWASEQLYRNPQWINQQIKRRETVGDLFL